MHTTTLRGVFPEPKPAYRRNFIKENVKSIKHMQGILQDAGVIQQRKQRFPEKYQNIPRLLKSGSSSRSNPNLNLVRAGRSDEKVPKSTNTATQMKTQKNKLPLRRDTVEEESKVAHRGMQTEREEDLSNLYDTGVIKYPSASIVRGEIKKKTEKAFKQDQGGQGDQADSLAEDMENLAMEDKDFVKENKQNIRPKPVKQASPKVLAQAPASYKRGEVPKYLRERKDEVPEVEEPDCPPGHILLPEDERKETLRVLRQSYADRIQELNMMPVRNDTLKMRKRKMDIEEELKRIDGGIKVFQRPKVFVKINA